MQRIRALALGALAATLVALPLAASAQDAPASETRPVAKPAKGTARPAAKPRRKPMATKTAPAPAAESYQLVPSGNSGSALSRARQNAFGTPDDEPTTPRGSRRVGIGLGGANGTTPGMTLGF